MTGSTRDMLTEAEVYDDLVASPNTHETAVFDEIVFPLTVRRREIAILNRAMRNLRGGTIAEIGCGPGWLTNELSSRGYKVIGLDVSRGMLKVAKQGARDAADFVQADASRLPFRSGSLDCIVSVGALHHLPSDGVMKSITLACRADSLMVAFEPNSLNLVAEIGRKIFPTEAHTPGERQFTPDELAGMVTAEGWTVVERGTIIHCAFLVSRLLAILKARNDERVRRLLGPLTDKLESLAESVEALAELGWIVYLVARKS